MIAALSQQSLQPRRENCNHPNFMSLYPNDKKKMPAGNYRKHAGIIQKFILIHHYSINSKLINRDPRRFRTPLPFVQSSTPSHRFFEENPCQQSLNT